MANYPRRFITVVFLTLIASSIVVWLSFYPAALRFIAKEKLMLLVCVVAMVIPIGFYPTITKRIPRLTVGLTLLASGTVSAACGAVAVLVFNVDESSVGIIFDLSQVLWALAAVTFIWQAVRNSRHQQKRDKLNGG